MSNNSREKGFTLIELLIVIGIIGFLAAAILVAVDPVKRIQDSRDSQRWSEVNAVLNAILTKQVDDRALFEGGDGLGAGNVVIPSDTLAQIIIDNGGSATAQATPACTTSPTTCNDVTTVSGLTGLNNTTTSSCFVDLDGLTPTFLAEVPLDPDGGLATDTRYFFNRNLGGRITVGACDAEQTTAVNVRR